MEVHASETKCPDFKFKILDQYSDALRRQICEAINISRIGTLNRKSEFNSNELCSLEVIHNTAEQERKWKDVFSSQKSHREKMKSFCDEMKKIKRVNIDTVPTPLTTNFSRSKNKRILSDQVSDYQSTPRKRQKRMDSSTPTHGKMAYRGLDSSMSPIKDPGDSGSESIESDGGNSMNKGERTNISDEVTRECKVKSIISESESVEEKKLLNQTDILTWVAKRRGLIPRSRSFPDLNTSWIATAFFKPYVYGVNTNINDKIRWRAHSTGSVDFTRWSNKDFSESMSEYKESIGEQLLTSIDQRMEDLMITGKCNKEDNCPPDSQDKLKEDNTEVVGTQNDHGPMGWGGMIAPGHTVAGKVEENGTQNDHSPMGWGGMNAPGQTVASNEEVVPGEQSGYSPLGWGGMNAPNQTATGNRVSSLILGKDADQEIMNSPAIASRMATPKRKQLDSTTINRRRRISLSEYIVDASPKLRPDRDSQHPPIGRTRTLSLGDTPNRPKITPKRRGKKKTVPVERDQPLI